jgi:hypothetical protein
VSKQSVQNKQTAAFALSLVAGILGIVAAFVLIVLAAAIGPVRIYSSYHPYSYTYNYTAVYILGGVGV